MPYAKFPRFHAVMAEDSGQSVLSSLESHIVPLVPGLADRLAAGMQMLDVGCGRGRIMNRLAELYPKSRFTGIDLSSEAILTANALDIAAYTHATASALVYIQTLISPGSPSSEGDVGHRLPLHYAHTQTHTAD